VTAQVPVTMGWWLTVELVNAGNYEELTQLTVYDLLWQALGPTDVSTLAKLNLSQVTVR
jgi:hypothetical protein